jgi:GNAT superfamily N-acetyltransferase
MPADQRGAGIAAGREGTFAVVVEEEIRACLHYSFADRAARPGVCRVAVWVEPDWRRQGMASALLLRCMAMTRAHGRRNLVLDCVGADYGLRQLALRFSADLIFLERECHAWLELEPGENARVGARVHDEVQRLTPH